MNFADIVKLVVTVLGAAVTAGGLIVQIRNLWPEWQNEPLAELKTILELRALLKPSEIEYHTLTAVIQERLDGSLFRKRRPVDWQEHIAEAIGYVIMFMGFLGLALYLFSTQRHWWGGICGFIAFGGLVNAGLALFKPNEGAQEQRPAVVPTLNIRVAPVDSQEVIRAIGDAASGVALEKSECELLKKWMADGIFKFEPGPASR